MTKIALTIAGVDPSGGAGIVADIKTFFAFGVFPTAAISSITFQNTQGVFGAEHQSAGSVRKQLEPILDDYEVEAVKTGMLPTREVIEEVAAIIAERGLKNIVVDPVVRSTSGFDLIDNAALRSLIEKLFPLADLVTPNIPEAERISGVAIETEQEVHDAASVMRDLGAQNVLIKGGHLQVAAGIARDYLFIGDELTLLEGEYFDTTATHGTGCTLSSGIAANLAIGNDLKTSVGIAKRFVNEAIRTAPMIGHGHSPINIKPI
jgi:hydroxymethylpyrimidine/phosphomethylpyrimidine kinase